MTKHTKSTDRPNNMLTALQSYQLHDWCKANAEAVMECTDSYAAITAGSNLGFAVTENNIAAVREHFGWRKNSVRAADQDAQTKRDLATIASILRRTSPNLSSDDSELLNNIQRRASP